MNLSLEEFVLKYEFRAKAWANFYYTILYDNGFEYEDLYQAGILKLIESYPKYDDSKSSLFTFADQMIRFGILNYINKIGHFFKIPNDVNMVLIKVLAKKNEFYKLTGRNMTNEEIKDFILNECYYGNYTIDDEYVKNLLKIEQYYFRKKIYSLDDNIDNYNTSYLGIFAEKEDLCVGDLVANDISVEDTAINNCYVLDVLDYVTNNFSERDIEIFKEVLGFIDGIPKTEQSLANKYECSRQAVNQRYKRVIGKVKEKFLNLE